MLNGRCVCQLRRLQTTTNIFTAYYIYTLSWQNQVLGVTTKSFYPPKSKIEIEIDFLPLTLFLPLFLPTYFPIFYSFFLYYFSPIYSPLSFLPFLFPVPFRSLLPFRFPFCPLFPESSTPLVELEGLGQRCCSYYADAGNQGWLC